MQSPDHIHTPIIMLEEKLKRLERSLKLYDDLIAMLHLEHHIHFGAECLPNPMAGRGSGTSTTVLLSVDTTDSLVESHLGHLSIVWTT